jgi:hypothetical protein
VRPGVSESVGTVDVLLVSRAKFTIGYSYRVLRAEVLVPPSYRGSSPRTVAVGVTELGGVTGPPQATGVSGSRPQRGLLGDWNGHVGC